MLNPQHFKELQNSGIDPALASLNFESLKGEEAEEAILYSPNLTRTNTGRLSASLLHRYQHLRKGGWFCTGRDPLNNWERMLWGCFKPDFPYVDRERKTIKYEHPPKTETRAFFLRVPLHIWHAVAKRYEVEMPTSLTITEDGEAKGFWQWVLDNNVPITITEGAKKCAALLSIGYAAIGLPGIYSGYRQPKNEQGEKTGIPYLIPELKLFATNDRKINFCLDQDQKPKTKKNVAIAISQTGKLFSKEKSFVFVTQWKPALGKGIDDVLVSKGKQAVEKILENSEPLEIWQVKGYSQLSYPPNLLINREFLTDKFADKFAIPAELKAPVNPQLLLIKSPKNTGKTELLAALVEPLLKEGKRVLLITHRTQLGIDLCNRLGIPYKEELKISDEGSLLGYGLCHHSLHIKSSAKFNPKEWEGATIIIDEVVQVLWDVLSSPLINKHRIQILQNLKEVLQIAVSTGGQIVAGDADLDDWAVDYLHKLINFQVNQFLIVNEFEPKILGKSWEIYTYKSTSPLPLINNLIEAIHQGEKVLVLCSSQEENSKWSTQNLEGFFQVRFPDKKILRIDSETIADPTHPAYGCTDIEGKSGKSKLNQLLKKYDIVLVSPTLETGVDIKEEHFDSVWGVFWGVQTCDGVRQFLARYRPPVPRHIWINKIGLTKIGNGETTPKGLYSTQDKVTKDLINRLGQAGFEEDIDSSFQSESINAFVKRGALINLQRKAYRATIEAKLAEEHTLIDASEAFNFSQDELKKLESELTTFRDELYLAHREAVQAIGNPDDLEYEKLKKQKSRTKDELRKFEHGTLSRRYQVPVTPELVKKDDEGWHPKILLNYHLTIGRKFVESKDKMAALKQLKNGEGKIWKPSFNHALMGTKIAFIEQMGLTKLLSLPEIRLKDIESIIDFGKKYERDLKAVGISANWEDKPMAVIKNLLSNLLGLKIVRLRREGSRGHQEWVYSAVAPDFEKDSEGNIILVDGQPISIPDRREQVFVQWLARDEAGMAKAEGNHKMYRSDTVVQHPIYIDDGEAELPLGCTTETQVKETEGNLPLESLAQSLGQCQTTAEIWTFVGDSSARLEQIRDAILFVENWSKRQWLIREWNEVMRASDCGELAA